MERVILKSEEKKSRSEIVKFLTDIAQKIDTGNVTLIQAEESVELLIPEELTLEIKVEEKIKQNRPRKLQLEIELEWYEGTKEESIKLG
ncbi:MAG: amphi-Trp domain-containing protein [Candidatus Hodarchaeales archaeon]|jgi:amphi-Trp domain-containing protein